MSSGLSDVAIAHRLQRLEEQVRMLCERLGVPYDDGTSGIDPAVVALVRDGKRIHAIKLYRELTGCDLGERSA